MARRTMNTRPERSEYRRSFVACGGGLRFRLKGTSGLEGRRIFMDSLHVDRRPPGDRVVRFLRGIPTFRIVGPEHVDLHTELSLQEAEDRKSTRLNSSHLVISYAVFCLKKT